jgi:hypothetical protein
MAIVLSWMWISKNNANSGKLAEIRGQNEHSG